MGNVVGSNTFNILGCPGLSGLVSGDLGLALAPSLLTFDIWVMPGFVVPLTVVTLVVAMIRRRANASGSP